MKETRSASQILFGYLPEQTVDLRGNVWKVRDWRYPKIRSDIDSDSLRREIIRHANPWRFADMDGGFVSQLEGKAKITVVTLDERNGVDVDPFPKIFICKSCNRIHRKAEQKCPCGARGKKGQLFFVGYHDKCGTLREPWIPSCKTHKQVKIVFPGTASATEIRFECPICNKLIREGFGYVKCDCGGGVLTFQPHRAASVYTPRSVVIVNPPSRERISAIAHAGGPTKALTWVTDGMTTQNVEHAPATKESLRQQLENQGLPPDIVERMLEVAEEKEGGLPEEKIVIPEDKRENAEAQAVTIALATFESRVSIEDLIEATSLESELGVLYRIKYKQAIKQAGLFSVDLIEKFPVLTGNYGYTRGDHDPGNSRLVPYKGRHGMGFKVYSEVAETEALFIRLDPLKVVKWLEDQGFSVPECKDEKSARLAILSVSELPNVTDPDQATTGNALFKLIHTYAHRFLRIAAVFAGIDRNALSELLVPLHLGFFIYAAARGDFVLGGLQAVYESEMHRLLDSVVYSEHRCALDPGCANAGSACMACLHIGEPSCRCFNRHLSRETLFGETGYLKCK